MSCVLHERKENRMRCHNRGDRRHVDDMAALRKVHIVHMLNDYWYYPEFGYYRKGKIHCSCPICSAKTNGASLQSRRPVDQAREGRITGKKITKALLRRCFFVCSFVKCGQPIRKLFYRQFSNGLLLLHMPGEGQVHATSDIADRIWMPVASQDSSLNVSTAILRASLIRRSRTISINSLSVSAACACVIPIPMHLLIETRTDISRRMT